MDNKVKKKPYWLTVLEKIQDIYDENPKPLIKKIRLIIFTIFVIIFPIGALLFAIESTVF